MRKISICIISASFLLLSSAYSADQKNNTIDGCEGEGCGCTHESKTNSDFTVYSDTNLKSKIVGNFSTGTEAKAVKTQTKVLEPGKAKVLSVSVPNINLKPGNEVTHIFYLGEGLTKVMHKGNWVEFGKDEVTLKLIKKPSYETWLEVQVGKAHGYTPSFPFVGCLE